MLEHKEITLGDRSVTYRVAGRGEPVVLIHGLSGSSEWWWRNIPSLARGFQVYLVDLPGFGSMRGHESGFVLDDAADWLALWMRSVGLDSAHLIGHSLGGYICIRLATNAPHLVRSLVLVAPAGVATDRSIGRYAVPLLRAATQLRPRFALLLAYDFLRAGPKTVWRAGRSIVSENIRHELRLLTHRVLLIWGRDDPMVPASLGAVFRSEIPNARLFVIDSVGHVPMIDRPGEFNDAVEAFLRGDDVGQ